MKVAERAFGDCLDFIRSFVLSMFLRDAADAIVIHAAAAVRLEDAGLDGEGYPGLNKGNIFRMEAYLPPLPPS